MMKINLTDNSISEPFSRMQLSSLFPFANKTIDALCKENDGLLLFPQCIRNSEDKIGDSPIFDIVNTDKPDDVRLVTGNVMGFIGVDNMQINIKSRFDDGSENFFLHYMLQKVMSYNLFDLGHQNDDDSIFDFLIFMFPRFLNHALEQGLYREYVINHKNDPFVKGAINVNRHISKNVPFQGKIAYTSRDYSCDNSLTQLIRHTIEYIKTKKIGTNLLQKDSITNSNVAAIIANTPSYSKNDRNKVIQKNLRVKQHPYYNHYVAIQKLCLQILRREETKFGEKDSALCGILFDGAWLWEEYLNTILTKVGFAHPENKKGKGKIYLFEDYDDQSQLHRSGVRYPDFWKDGVVLDAKYKRIAHLEKVSKIDRNDIHQMVTYMYRLKARVGGFIAPAVNEMIKIPTSRLAESDATISIFSLQISRSKDYSAFCENMIQNENRLLRNIQDVCKFV